MRRFSLQCRVYAAILVPEPSAPKPTWLDKLPVNEGSGSSATPTSETLYLPSTLPFNSTIPKSPETFHPASLCWTARKQGCCEPKWHGQAGLRKREYLYSSTVSGLPPCPSWGSSYSLLWWHLAREQSHRGKMWARWSNGKRGCQRIGAGSSLRPRKTTAAI